MTCHIRHVEHGRCDQETQICKCDPVAKEFPKNETYAGQMWTGPTCEEKSCPSETGKAVCSGHGLCDGTLGACACVDGWRSKDCSQRSCPNECSNNGKCLVDPQTKSARCECDDSHEGEDCSMQICPKRCSGHGKCHKVYTRVCVDVCARACVRQADTRQKDKQAGRQADRQTGKHASTQVGKAGRQTAKREAAKEIVNTTYPFSHATSSEIQVEPPRNIQFRIFEDGGHGNILIENPHSDDRPS